MELLDQRSDEVIGQLRWFVPVVIFAIKVDLGLEQGLSVFTCGLIQCTCRNLNRLESSILLLLLDCNDHLSIPFTLTMAATLELR